MKGVKSIRLKHYDYKSNGYYFVTICTDYKKPYLKIPEIKNIVVDQITGLNEMEGVKLDYFVIMPNHIHLIIILDDSQFSLFEVLKRFKYKTTVLVKKLAKQRLQNQNCAKQAWQLQDRLWQPNYYEHIIRNETALRKIREYIENNPHLEQIMFDQFYK
jgi:putative transposase